MMSEKFDITSFLFEPAPATGTPVEVARKLKRKSKAIYLTLGATAGGVALVGSGLMIPGLIIAAGGFIGLLRRVAEQNEFGTNLAATAEGRDELRKINWGLTRWLFDVPKDNQKVSQTG